MESYVNLCLQESMKNNGADDEFSELKNSETRSIASKSPSSNVESHISNSQQDDKSFSDSLIKKETDQMVIIREPVIKDGPVENSEIMFLRGRHKRSKCKFYI